MRILIDAMGGDLAPRSNALGAIRAAQELGVELWDVEFKKEGSDYFLRIYLDREGGIDIALRCGEVLHH